MRLDLAIFPDDHDDGKFFTELVARAKSVDLELAQANPWHAILACDLGMQSRCDLGAITGSVCA